jgi:hypothetical protein
MLIHDTVAFAKELIECGNFVSDFNHENIFREAERRFNRYIELVGEISGDEGPLMIKALADSIQMEEDYGVYQVTIDALIQFLHAGNAEAMIEALADMMQVRPDLAVDLMLRIAHQHESYDFMIEFNRALSLSTSSAAGCVRNFVMDQERFGLLDEFSGMFARHRVNVA